MCGVLADLNIELPTDPLKYLGHDEVHDTVNSIGYAEIGERRDILLVPPLSNITVSFSFAISKTFCLKSFSSVMF